MIYKRIILEIQALFIISFYIRACVSHGRLIEPPSRASAWRYGFQTPPDYNDHELYCGGFQRQWKRNGGKCGECGDAWDMTLPRPHENGGQWGQGIIVRSYHPGSDINIRVELTASHMGYFEFRLCPDPNAKQECLDKHLLKIFGGSPLQSVAGDLDTRFYPRNGSRIYDIKAHLPDMKCDQCVLQWRYVAGNNWGMCDDGVGAVGCGPQEEFRSCSDIALTDSAHTPIRPFRPTFRTTVKPQIPGSTSELPQETEQKNALPWVLVCVVLCFLLLCFLGYYLYHKKEDTFKNKLQKFSENFCQKKTNGQSTMQSVILPNRALTVIPQSIQSSKKEKFDNDIVPIPPPRTKRLSKVKELGPEQSSIA